VWGEEGEGTGLGSDPTDISDTELAGEKGASSVSVSNMKLAIVLLSDDVQHQLVYLITITRVYPTTTLV